MPLSKTFQGLICAVANLKPYKLQMKITANSKIFEIRDNLKVSDFIAEQGLIPRRCVVELNGEAMKFSEFENLFLRDGDVLEIMQIVAGG